MPWALLLLGSGIAAFAWLASRNRQSALTWRRGVYPGIDSWLSNVRNLNARGYRSALLLLSEMPREVRIAFNAGFEGTFTPEHVAIIRAWMGPWLNERMPEMVPMLEELLSLAESHSIPETVNEPLARELGPTE